MNRELVLANRRGNGRGGGGDLELIDCLKGERELELASDNLHASISVSATMAVPWPLH